MYTGQQYDQVTGQHYLRARYYNPLLGRFLQEDVYRGDGLNLYAYCDNNPVVYYDPSGYSNQYGAAGKPSTRDLNDAIGSIAQSLGWTVTHGAKGHKEEYFPGLVSGGRQGSHKPDLTLSKNIDDQIVTVRINTTTDAKGNIPDTRERRNAQELNQQIKLRNAQNTETDSLGQIVTISKTNGNINNVDYNQITQPVDPFNQQFQNPNVADEMNNLKEGLNKLAKEMADGKTAAQIAQDYDAITAANQENEKVKRKENGCNGEK